MKLSTMIRAAVVFALVAAAALIVLGGIVAAAMWVAMLPLRIIGRRQRRLDELQAIDRGGVRL